MATHGGMASSRPAEAGPDVDGIVRFVLGHPAGERAAAASRAGTTAAAIASRRHGFVTATRRSA